MKEMLRANAKSWRWSGTSSVQQSARSSRQQVTMSRDLMQENCDDCEAVLESTSETSDEEDTYERPGENIRITSAERLRCTEPTTNLYRTLRSLTTTPARIRALVSCCLMARPAHGEVSECGPRHDFCFSNSECRSQLGRKAGPR